MLQNDYFRNTTLDGNLTTTTHTPSISVVMYGFFVVNIFMMIMLVIISMIKFDSLASRRNQIPLASYQNVPAILRYMIPYFCWFCVYEFYLAQTIAIISLETTVLVSGQLTKNEASFSTITFIQYLVSKKAYLSATLLFLCGGVLPYIKIEFLLFVWLAPTTLISLETREYFIKSIRIVGKWTNIILFMFMILMSIYRLEKSSLLLPEQIHIKIVPKAGMLSYIVATFLFNIMSNLVYFYNSNDFRQEYESMYISLDNDDQLSAKQSLKKIVNIFLMITSTLFLFFGLTENLYVLTYKLDVANDVKKVSVFDIINENLHTEGMFWLQITTMFLVVTVPILRVKFILQHEIIRLFRGRSSTTNFFLLIIKFIDEWECFEVFLVSFLMVTTDIKKCQFFRTADKQSVLIDFQNEQASFFIAIYLILMICVKKSL